MVVPSRPGLCLSLIRVIRKCQSERAAAGVRGHNSTLIYLRMNVMEIFHYGLLASKTFFFLTKTVMMLRNCCKGILFAQAKNRHLVISACLAFTCSLTKAYIHVFRYVCVFYSVLLVLSV